MNETLFINWQRTFCATKCGLTVKYDLIKVVIQFRVNNEKSDWWRSKQKFISHDDRPGRSVCLSAEAIWWRRKRQLLYLQVFGLISASFATRSDARRVLSTRVKALVSFWKCALTTSHCTTLSRADLAKRWRWHSLLNSHSKRGVRWISNRSITARRI